MNPVWFLSCILQKISFDLYLPRIPSKISLSSIAAPFEGGRDDQDSCSSCGLAALKLSGNQRKPDSACSACQPQSFADHRL
jgi:hypothetical protein